MDASRSISIKVQHVDVINQLCSDHSLGTMQNNHLEPEQKYMIQPIKLLGHFPLFFLPTLGQGKRINKQ